MKSLNNAPNSILCPAPTAGLSLSLSLLSQKVLNLKTHPLKRLLLQIPPNNLPQHNRARILQPHLNRIPTHTIQLLLTALTNVNRDIRTHARAPQRRHPLPVVKRRIGVADGRGAGECVRRGELVAWDECDWHAVVTACCDGAGLGAVLARLGRGVDVQVCGLGDEGARGDVGGWGFLICYGAGVDGAGS